MKYVKKVGAPTIYSNWCRCVKGSVNEHYNNLQNPEKEALHETLLKEQGWICAYTMRRINKDTSHIEHIKPESLCRKDAVGSDLDYSNMVACFPKEGMIHNYRYGAQLKDKWWVNDGADFISPLNSLCEKMISFDIEGVISAIKNDPAAVTTIDVLGLDHDSLTEDRRRVIQEFIFGPEGKTPLTRAKVVAAINTICNLNGSDKYYEFCVAIRCALPEYVLQLDKRAARKRMIKKAQRRI
jgi:uncharacterized protein (TIGR02646 family)